MFRKIFILLAMMAFLALLSPMSYTLAMICLLALPNILQQREEADHRVSLLHSTGMTVLNNISVTPLDPQRPHRASISPLIELYLAK